MPAEKEDFDIALDTLPVHPALLYAVQHLSQTPLLEQHSTCAHLNSLFSAAVSSGFWACKDATGFKKPMLGTKPGTTMATDAFNYIFSPMIRELQDRLRQEELTWVPDLDPEDLRFARSADMDMLHDTVSFVDDLTA